jgi:hypothetical protein
VALAVKRAHQTRWGTGDGGRRGETK